MTTEIKQQLYNLCLQHIHDNIWGIEAAILEAREATRNETKSSMGDKYETAREMLQQDINMNMDRLQKAKAEQLLLQQIVPEQKGTFITNGSLVQTNNGTFYIGISAGKLSVNNETYYAISLSSPIGSQLKGKQQGDVFTLNGKHYKIEKVL
jgi:peptidase E